MQHGQEDGAFDGKPEAALGEQVSEDVAAAGELPQALKNEGRPDRVGGDGGELALAVSGQQQEVLSNVVDGRLKKGGVP
jgi:hypothetical protein